MEKNDNFKSELETQYSILIQNKEKNEQKRFIFITTILVVTLCSVLCSIVFSFIAFKNSKNINLSTKVRDITYYQTLSVKYNGDNQLSLTNITNNYELPVPKTIEITNEGTTDIVFDIKLSSINTSLLSTNKLVYTLLRNNEVVVNKELPLGDKVIASDIKISPDETLYYVLQVNFNGSLEDNNNANYYNSKIIIEQKNNKSNLLE